MSETKPPEQTNEEVLEEEIRDLERPSLKSWGVWGAAFALLIVAVVVVAVFVKVNRVGEEKRIAERVARVPPVAIVVHGPVGILDAPPDAFRWAPLAGAASYVVTVKEKEHGDVVIQRPVSAPYLTPTDVESSDLVPGRYLWTIEARRADGTRAGSAETEFAIEAPTEAGGNDR
jgi:hypothetical protein